MGLGLEILLAHNYIQWKQSGEEAQPIVSVHNSKTSGGFRVVTP